MIFDNIFSLCYLLKTILIGASGELDNDSGKRGAKEEREILGIITSIQVKISRIHH